MNNRNAVIRTKLVFGLPDFCANIPDLNAIHQTEGWAIGEFSPDKKSVTFTVENKSVNDATYNIEFYNDFVQYLSRDIATFITKNTSLTPLNENKDC